MGAPALSKPTRQTFDGLWPMTGRGHATAAPRRMRKSRRLMTNLRVDPLHFSPESRWQALAPTGASQLPAATASGFFGTCRRGRVGVAPVAPTRVQDLSFETYLLKLIF